MFFFSRNIPIFNPGKVKSTVKLEETVHLITFTADTNFRIQGSLRPLEWLRTHWTLLYSWLLFIPEKGFRLTPAKGRDT